MAAFICCCLKRAAMSQSHCLYSGDGIANGVFVSFIALQAVGLRHQLKHIVLVCFDLLRQEHLLDDTVLVDEVGGAEYADGAASARHLLAPATEPLQEGGLRVGYQRELK